MIKAVVIGCGGIARAAHLPAYEALQREGKVQLVAICDIDPKRFDEKMAINIGEAAEVNLRNVRRYTDWREMVEKERPEMADICLPTFLHAETACELLARGLHVLSEKPMALTYDQCREMTDAAEKASGKLMIAQCLRFSKAYVFLKEAVERGTYGKPLGGVFRRLSPPPMWAWENWLMDPGRSGGAVLDLHIHDIDSARFIFGEPLSVSCRTADVYSGDDSAHSRLNYGDFALTVIGDWSLEGLPFTADYTVSFEKATVRYENGAVTVYPRGGEPVQAVPKDVDFYAEEIKFFVDMISSGKENTVIPPESAAATVKLIETLRASAAAGGKEVPFGA